MKLLLLFLLLFTSHVHAQETFWDTVQKIQDKLYTIEKLPLQEDNTTLSVTDTRDKSDLIDTKFAYFNQLIGIIKSQPYEVQESNNSYFNPKLFYQERSTLTAKIAVNQEHNYEVAVMRDRIALDDLHAKDHTFQFLKNIAKNWMNYDSNATQTHIQNEREWLKTLPMKSYQDYASTLKLDENSSISMTLYNNYESLYREYHFLNDFLYFLELNPDVISYDSFASKLNLISIINNVNALNVSRDMNIYLRYLGLDIGRISIFIAIIILFGTLNYIIYYYLYALIRKLILYKHHDIDDLLLSNIELVRKPMFLLLLTLGFEIGLDILLYPNTYDAKGPYFFAFYTAVIAYIFIMITDHFFFELFFVRKHTKHVTVRNELVNLMVSIIKAVIIIIAILLFLVRIDVNITGILTSLGIGGLAVAFAAQSTLTNFFGLIKIITDNSFSQGDWIVNSEVEGTVVEIGFISTKIRTFDNALVTVPNSTLANSSLKNWNRRSIGRRIKMHVGVGYSSKREDLQKAIDQIDTMLREHEGIAVDVQHETIEQARKDRKLVSVEDKYGVKSTLLVYLDQFSDSSIDILIYAFTNTVNWQEWLGIKQDVYFKIWEILEANNLDFAYPSQSLYFDKNNIAESFESIRKNV
jgi:MscS family membrane protein